MTATTSDVPAVTDGRMALAGPKKDGHSLRPSTGGESADLAALTDPSDKRKRSADVERERSPARVYERRPKVAVDSQSRRYVSSPRRKFGPWFFRQQDTWNN
jgi:hypothetical protein